MHYQLKAARVSKLVDQVAKPTELVPAEGVAGRHRPGEVLGSQPSSPAVSPVAVRRLLPILGVPPVLEVKGLENKGKNDILYRSDILKLDKDMPRTSPRI